MFRLLVKTFIKRHNDIHDPSVRKSYATLSSAFGIFLNVVLFAAKYAAGILSGSTAVTADAFNNLSDAVSSVISFVGFYLSEKKPDKKHPFGHGRIEYISGLIISAIILILGFQFAISSIKKIISPEPVTPGILPALIMALSILIKLYMFLYNRNIGRKIDSTALLATATDSLTDCLATIAALISMGIMYIWGINVDGIAGTVVSLFIIYAGISSALETISPLLGRAPSEETVEGIKETVLAHPEIKGIHDLIIDDYGPGHMFLSLHAEVDGSESIFDIHNVVDQAEHELNEKYHCIATIHMDPVESDNSDTNRLKDTISSVVTNIYPGATIHDFRMIPDGEAVRISFDTVLPDHCKDNIRKAQDKIQTAVNDLDPCYQASVNIDNSFL